MQNAAAVWRQRDCSAARSEAEILSEFTAVSIAKLFRASNQMMNQSIYAKIVKIK